MSITVCWNAWPMCRVPVTFGGGSRMQYGSPWPDGLKSPLASQAAYHFDSIWPGSKLLSIRGSRLRAGAGAWGLTVKGRLYGWGRWGAIFGGTPGVLSSVIPAKAGIQRLLPFARLSCDGDLVRLRRASDLLPE